MEKRMILHAQDKLETALTQARSFLEQSYLDRLSGCEVLKTDHADVLAQMRMIRLTKIAFNEKDIHARLVSVYHTMAELADACFLLVCGRGSGTELYLGVRSDKTTMAYDALKSAMKGNFPGTVYDELESDKIRAVMQTLNTGNSGRANAVVLVSQVPSLRERDDGRPGMNVQGLEHFIDTMQGKTYTAMILAVPLSAEDTRRRRTSLENMYTSLSSLEKITCQYGDSISLSRQESLTKGITDSLTKSVSEGFTSSCTRSSGKNSGHGTSAGILGVGFNSNSGAFSSEAWQNGESIQKTNAVGTAEQVMRAVSDSITRALSRSKSFTQTNKTVLDLLGRVDENLKRIRECETYGAWDACAFFVAEEYATACVAANAYKALVCGQKSGLERSVLNAWDNDVEAVRERSRAVCRSIAGASMPQFRLANGSVCTPGRMISGEEMPILMSLPCQSVNGVVVMNMAPFGREVVMESGEKPTGIELGRVYHMGEVEEGVVPIAYDALCSHALITGAAGVGKSVAVGKLLYATQTLNSMFGKAGVSHPPIKFMLIEPVKGEFKYMLGGVKDLQVFTTNPLSYRMLRINPFEVEPGTTIRSHLDRLMDVLCVCWPMYAAQPAVLRDCLEEAYIRAGWDLSNSMYVRPGAPVYPNFKVLLETIPDVIKESKFVGEAKGGYEGGLLARVKMFTRGVYDEIFNSSASVSSKELFEHNTIIDLSETGSQEAVSLIMGLLVMRLREYRIAQGVPKAVQLRHLMVLEEAHNLLPSKTPGSVEGGENITGKSVGMIVNSIAEMRGYGQGFIIIDQSPSMIDSAGIRNTATKIVMRLPAADDQKTVADAMALTEQQMQEIARFPERTALIYQKNWVEPVLTRIGDKAKLDEAARKYGDEATYQQICRLRGACAAGLLEMQRAKKLDLGMLERTICSVPVNACKKTDYVALFRGIALRAAAVDMNDTRRRLHFFGRLLEELLGCEDFFRLLPVPQALRTDIPASQDVDFINSAEAWRKDALTMLAKYVDGLDDAQMKELLRLLLLGHADSQDVTRTHNALYGRVQV